MQGEERVLIKANTSSLSDADVSARNVVKMLVGKFDSREISGTTSVQLRTAPVTTRHVRQSHFVGNVHDQNANSSTLNLQAKSELNLAAANSRPAELQNVSSGNTVNEQIRPTPRPRYRQQKVDDAVAADTSAGGGVRAVALSQAAKSAEATTGIQTEPTVDRTETTSGVADPEFKRRLQKLLESTSRLKSDKPTVMRTKPMVPSRNSLCLPADTNKIATEADSENVSRMKSNSAESKCSADQLTAESIHQPCRLDDMSEEESSASEAQPGNCIN